MTSPRILASLLLVLLTPSAASSQAQQPTVLDSDPPVFPAVTAENLLGESFDLPDDLPGRIRVVFVAFRQRQQPEVNTWLAIGDRLEADFDGLRYFEFPTIWLPFRLMKPMIDNGMRGGIPSRAARARTLTLFTNVSRFVTTTGLPGTDRIAVLLLDGEGRIRWSVTGSHSPDRERALRRAIEAVRDEG